MLYVENQEVAVFYGRLMQCIDSQVLRCCGKEGTKKPHRSEKECGNAFLMRFSLGYFFIQRCSRPAKQAECGNVGMC